MATAKSTNNIQIQQQSIVNSYALPPHSRLVAPPCSLYCKRAQAIRPWRQTYLAVGQAKSARNPRLTSISEDLGKPRDGEPEPRAPERRDQKLRHGSIVAMDVILSPTESNTQSSNSIVVAYDNGNIDCISGDLSSIRWQHDEKNDGTVVEYTTILDVETARKGLLKGREDILALFESTTRSWSGESPPLLFQVLRRETQRSIRLYAMRNTYGGPLQAQRAPLDELLSYDIPSQKKVEHATLRYELHAASGILYQQVDSQLVLFDLSRTLPRISFRLGRGAMTRIDSFTRLSNATVLIVSGGKITVHDTKYGSILSSLAYPDALPADKHQRSLDIVSPFTDISTVVAMWGTDLLAFQIGDILDDGSRARPKCPHLVDVMGKGRLSKASGPDLPGHSEKKRKRWESWTLRVDEYVAQRNIAGLDNLVAADLKLVVPGNHLSRSADDRKQMISAGDSGPGQYAVWDLPPHAYDPEHVNARKAIYLLSKLFTWSPPGPDTHHIAQHLRVVLASRNILRWLAMAGYLTPFHIQHAMVPGRDTENRIEVTAGQVMVAVQNADPTFMLMCDLLSLPIHWDLAEVVQALQTLVASFEDKWSNDQAEHTRGSSDGDIMSAAAAEEAYLESEVDALDRQLVEAQNILESGLAVRSEACRIIIARLHAFPQKAVVEHMHNVMSYEDLVFFICILRVELNDGGWVYDYVDGTTYEQASVGLGNAHELAPSNQAIRSIAHLFGCAVDAIGLSGWLVGKSADVVGTLNLVHDMRNEISATLEGLYEAEHLGIMLKDMSKAAVMAQQQPNGAKRKRQGQDEIDCEEVLLPLEGRLAPPQLKTWSPKDGMKSKAAIGQEKSRNVGQYSFERIRI